MALKTLRVNDQMYAAAANCRFSQVSGKGVKDFLVVICA